jgi:hypothetical protein
MANTQAAYDLYDALADMLSEYEYDTQCNERTGMNTDTQRDIILRAKKAIAKFRGEPVAKCYWEEEE